MSCSSSPRDRDHGALRLLRLPLGVEGNARSRRHPHSLATLFFAFAALLAVLGGKGDGLWAAAIEPALERAFKTIATKKL